MRNKAAKNRPRGRQYYHSRNSRGRLRRDALRCSFWRRIRGWICAQTRLGFAGSRFVFYMVLTDTVQAGHASYQIPIRFVLDASTAYPVRVLRSATTSSMSVRDEINDDPRCNPFHNYHIRVVRQSDNVCMFKEGLLTDNEPRAPPTGRIHHPCCNPSSPRKNSAKPMRNGEKTWQGCNAPSLGLPALNPSRRLAPVPLPSHSQIRIRGSSATNPNRQHQPSSHAHDFVLVTRTR